MHFRVVSVCVLWAAGVALTPLVGCTYRREYGYKPFFTGLDGAEFSTPASADVQGSRGSSQRLVEPRMTNEDGSIRLINATGRHLMINIMYCLDQDDATLFVEQVLSDHAVSDAYDHGRDPEDVFGILKENVSDVRELFMRMPFGEHTPTVMMKSLGPNKIEIRLTGIAARGLKWKSVSMVMERGGWRLIWFGK